MIKLSGVNLFTKCQVFLMNLTSRGFPGNFTFSYSIFLESNFIPGVPMSFQG